MRSVCQNAMAQELIEVGNEENNAERFVLLIQGLKDEVCW